MGGIGPVTNSWLPDKGAVGAYIRSQRELANLSLRELSRLSQVSNAYLSQVERGLHEPSLRVMSAVADALSVPLQDLLSRTQEGAGDQSEKDNDREVDVEAAIRAERRLNHSQQEALIAVYRSYLAVSAVTSVLDPVPKKKSQRSEA